MNDLIKAWRRDITPVPLWKKLVVGGVVIPLILLVLWIMLNAAFVADLMVGRV